MMLEDLKTSNEEIRKALGEHHYSAVSVHIQIHTVDGRNRAPVEVGNRTIHRVLYMSGGAGFLPSPV